MYTIFVHYLVKLKHTLRVALISRFKFLSSAIQEYDPVLITEMEMKHHCLKEEFWFRWHWHPLVSELVAGVPLGAAHEAGIGGVSAKCTPRLCAQELPQTNYLLLVPGQVFIHIVLKL